MRRALPIVLFACLALLMLMLGSGLRNASIAARTRREVIDALRTGRPLPAEAQVMFFSMTCARGAKGTEADLRAALVAARWDTTTPERDPGPTDRAIQALTGDQQSARLLDAHGRPILVDAARDRHVTTVTLWGGVPDVPDSSLQSRSCSGSFPDRTYGELRMIRSSDDYRALQK